MAMHDGRILIGLAFLLLALPAGAQIYKSTLPDGRVVFGDKPDRNAVRIETLAPASPAGAADAQQAEAARKQLLREADSADQRLRQRKSMLDAADEEIAAAQRDLSAAKQRLEEATEPEAGERTGTAGKGSQLNPAYWERQEALKREVQNQTDRLERAYRQRNELAP